MVDFNKIATKWQKKWEASKIFNVKEDSKKKKYYVLEMYPYPSGSGLHMGHARNYCIGDAFARFKRMQGFNVLYPMGYDSFGLPAENAAIEAKSHPKIFTEDSIKTFIKQQKSLGLSYDWNRMVETHKPDYYKWDQWIFLKMFEKGLAYKKKSDVNWCPKCNTVLANEQVHNGRCWRHGDTEVEAKELDQWFLKTTDYAEELLRDLKKLEWSEDVKLMQKNWIGKSHGVDVTFKVKDKDITLDTFTTTIDTMYGVTFLVISPEHPLLKKLVTKENKEKVDKYVEEAKRKTDEERIENKDKTGIFTGSYLINPVNGEECPLWVSDYVLMSYGTGVVMGVPAHDQRDLDFANQYSIEIIQVLESNGGSFVYDDVDKYNVKGKLINSDKFNDMYILEAREEITKHLEKQGMAKRTTQYKLRDWLISRQRFWGTPIPIIYCDKCGTVAVPEKDLPVKLPDNIKFSSATNPLIKYKPFVNVKCPKCKCQAKRETDTMDTFVNSSWYFLRYCDPKNQKEIFNPKKANYWMPIDQYVGGREHACMHLIYFRFYTKFLRDLGLLKFDEPAIKLFNQGMLHKNGVVMSKSKGNVVMPEEVADKYGIDTARLFLLFVAGPDKDMEWSDESVEGNFRFLNKFYSLVDKKITDKKDPKQESKINKTIKESTEYIEEFKFNMAIISLMELTNYLFTKEEINKGVLEKLILLMSVFTPHVCEEMWEKLGNKEFVSVSKWPKFDKSKIDEISEAEEESISQLILDINKVLELTKIETPKKITLFIAEKWKYDFFSKIKISLAKTRDIGEIIKACMDVKHQKEISQLVPKLVKNESKIPRVIIEQSQELKNLEQNKNLIKDHFKCAVEIVKADDSKETKAKQAIPSKPAIFIE